MNLVLLICVGASVAVAWPCIVSCVNQKRRNAARKAFRELETERREKRLRKINRTRAEADAPLPLRREYYKSKHAAHFGRCCEHLRERHDDTDEEFRYSSLSQPISGFVQCNCGAALRITAPDENDSLHLRDVLELFNPLIGYTNEETIRRAHDKKLGDENKRKALLCSLKKGCAFLLENDKRFALAKRQMLATNDWVSIELVKELGEVHPLDWEVVYRERTLARRLERCMTSRNLRYMVSEGEDDFTAFHAVLCPRLHRDEDDRWLVDPDDSKGCISRKEFNRMVRYTVHPSLARRLDVGPLKERWEAVLGDFYGSENYPPDESGPSVYPEARAIHEAFMEVLELMVDRGRLTRLTWISTWPLVDQDVDEEGEEEEEEEEKAQEREENKDAKEVAKRNDDDDDEEEEEEEESDGEDEDKAPHQRNSVAPVIMPPPAAYYFFSRWPIFLVGVTPAGNVVGLRTSTIAT